MGAKETGWHWGDDVLVDNNTGELDLDTGFEAAGKVLGGAMKAVLGKEAKEEGDGGPLAGKEGLGFEARDVFFWGFGQGGMVALSFCEAFGREMGGVVAICGKMPASKSAMRKAIEILGSEIAGEWDEKKAKTPVLLCGGNRRTAVTSSALKEVKERCETVQYVKWEREGDGMPRNREEMLPIMKFLAQRLKMPAPVGTEEVGGVARA